MRQLVTAVVLSAGLLLICASRTTNAAAAEQEKNFLSIKNPPSIGPQLHTNIALIGAQDPITTIQREQPNVLVDPSGLYDQASEKHRLSDIQEDTYDRFVTTRSGKPRARLAETEDAETWADESPLYESGALIRKKRCGGNDDDDGDASRARRARRSRVGRARRTRRARAQRRRARKSARKAARKITTTITRTVMPASQVVSHQQGSIVTTVPQPVVIQQHQTPGQVVQTFQT